MAFGDRLQALRRGNGLTQEEFAAQLKVTRQAVSKWESSRGYPEIEKIIYICNRYGVTMDELFQDEVPSPRGAADPSKALPAEESFDGPPLKKAFANFLSNLSPADRITLLTGLFFALVCLLVVSFFLIPKGGTASVFEKYIWLALLILFGVGEAVTVGLTSIWFAAGALVALIAALLGAEVWLQIVIFLVVSGLCLLAVRPLTKKFLSPGYQPTNADRVIGAEAVVTEEINNLLGQGTVQVAGLAWTARSAEDGVIPAGAVVRVERIEGVKLFVRSDPAAVSNGK